MSSRLGVYIFDSGVTFAIAKQAPVGVVIMAHSHRLSRVYSWDTNTDTFVPGQFLKARAQVLDISDDGKYFSYHAENSYSRGENRYSCISKLLYFTALAYFPGRNLVEFQSRFTVVARKPVLSQIGLHKGHPGLEWITPNCPFKIVQYEEERQIGIRDEAIDSRLHRKIWSFGLDLIAEKVKSKEQKVLATFPTHEDLIEIKPPDWAKVW